MGKIRIVLLFEEENEKQRQAGEFLKTQKRCKTALITELIHAWIYNKEGKELNERNYAKRPDRIYLYSSRQH